MSGAPSLTVFAAVEGTMELTYGYRETAGTDATAATDAAAGGSESCLVRGSPNQ